MSTIILKTNIETSQDEIWKLKFSVIIKTIKMSGFLHITSLQSTLTSKVFPDLWKLSLEKPTNGQPVAIDLFWEYLQQVLTNAFLIQEYRSLCFHLTDLFNLIFEAHKSTTGSNWFYRKMHIHCSSDKRVACYFKIADTYFHADRTLNVRARFRCACHLFFSYKTYLEVSNYKLVPRLHINLSK